jgi:hypothetical protein
MYRPVYRSPNVRILVNFMRRDRWSVHCLAPDCKTLVSQWVTIQTEETLLRLFKASGAITADMDEIERDVKRWGRGSALIDVNETGRRLLRILPQA